MSETKTLSTPPKRWLRRLTWLAIGLALLLIVLYFVATSGAFFKGVILPRVSKALNANITVAEASISPFSQVRLRGLKVQTTGTEPLLAAQEVVARYSLFDIIGGTIRVDEVSIESPVVHLVTQADGSSNLDPILESTSSTADAPPEQPGSGSSTSIDVRTVTLKNALVQVVKNHGNGQQDLTELSGLNLSVENLKNGETGKLTLGAKIKVDNNPPAPGTNGFLTASLDGKFDFQLLADLNPGPLNGSMQMAVEQARGAMADLSSLAADLDCEVSLTEVKQLSLQFKKDTAALGRILVSGPFDVAKQEGNLTLEVRSIDRQVLNLVGAGSGVDFTSTTLNATNQITIAQGGNLIDTRGQVKIDRLSLRQNDQTTPTVDLLLQYSTSFDQAKQLARLQSFSLVGTKNSQPFLRGQLASPMEIALGDAAASLPDSALQITLIDFQLADWKPVLGETVPEGRLNATLNLLAQESGKKLSIDLTSQIDGLSINVASNEFRQGNAQVRLRAQVSDMNQVLIQEGSLALTQRGNALVSGTVAGTAQVEPQSADLQLTLEATLPNVLEAFPQPDVSVRTGTVAWKGQVTHSETSDIVLGQLTVNQFTGLVAGYGLTNVTATMDHDLTQAGQALDLRKIQLSLPPTARAKNEVRLTGKLDLTDTNATQGELNLTAESLDLTPYYDLAAGTPATVPAPTGDTKPTSTPAPGEPEPIEIPLRDFTLNVNIGELYLHEVAIKNWQTRVRIDQNKVQIKPFQLALNDAPVTLDADLNLGVPGYQYDLNLDAAGIPLEPLANTFMPEKKGMYQGDLTARGNVKGAGVSGAKLREALQGQLEIGMTNANIQLVSPKLKAFLTPIAALLRAPAILESPLNNFNLMAGMGQGKVNVSTLHLATPAFLADTKGQMSIADKLFESRFGDWAMDFALSRGLAEKIPGAPKPASPEAAYVQMPSFVKVGGSLDEPAAGLDKSALLQSGLSMVADKLSVDETTKSLIQGISGILGGAKPAPTNQPASDNGATNAPAPEKKFNPFDLLKKP